MKKLSLLLVFVLLLGFVAVSCGEDDEEFLTIGFTFTNTDNSIQDFFFTQPNQFVMDRYANAADKEAGAVSTGQGNRTGTFVDNENGTVTITIVTGGGAGGPWTFNYGGTDATLFTSSAPYTLSMRNVTDAVVTVPNGLPNGIVRISN